MTLKEIKEAVENGKKVYWQNQNYQVVKDCIGQWMIKCQINNSCIGLTARSGMSFVGAMGIGKLNGKPEDFYIAEGEAAICRV